MILVKQRILKRALALTLPLAGICQAHAQDSTQSLTAFSCKVEFANGSDKVNETVFQECVEQHPLKELMYISIFSTASPPGTIDDNQDLSNRRAENVKKLLLHFKVPIQIQNGGESKVYDKQATATFFALTDGVTPSVKPPAASQNSLLGLDIYAGLGILYLSSPLSDYTPSSVLTYTVGLNHTVKRFSLWQRAANMYVGASLSKALASKTLPQIGSGSTLVASSTDVHYVRNDVSVLVGVERVFTKSLPLSSFLEVGPQLQERILTLASLGAKPIATADAKLTLGLMANIGVKYDFLAHNPRLDSVGIEHLSTRLGLYSVYGPKTQTSSLGYKAQPENVNMNPFAWGPVLNIGCSL